MISEVNLAKHIISVLQLLPTIFEVVETNIWELTLYLLDFKILLFSSYLKNGSTQIKNRFGMYKLSHIYPFKHICNCYFTPLNLNILITTRPIHFIMLPVYLASTICRPIISYANRIYGSTAVMFRQTYIQRIFAQVD